MNRKEKKYLERTFKVFYQIIIGFVLFVGCLSFASRVEHYYNREGRIQQYDNGLYTIVDNSGNEWEFYDKNGMHPVNSQVVLHMHDNNTSNDIFDDIVKEIEER